MLDRRCAPVVLGVALAATAACGNAIRPADGSLDGGDGFEPPDGGSEVVDIDNFPPPDVAADTSDGAPSVDAPPIVDADPADMLGTWRTVGYELRTGPGMLARVTDTNTTVTTATGSTLQIRVNGTLTITPSRIAMAFGILAQDHFFANTMAPTVLNALSAYGFGAPGMPTPDGFELRSGARLALALTDANTLVQTDMMTGVRTTWARTTMLPELRSIRATGIAHLYRPLGTMPFTRPRVALVWERAGSAGAFVSSNDQVLSPAMGNQFSLDVSTPAPEAIGTIGGVRVAVAYVIVYDDSNDDLRFDPGGTGPGADVLRGVSPVAIAYREGDASLMFNNSVLRDLRVGLQFVHLHQDGSLFGRVSATPFDSTHAASPDVVINPDVETTPIPDLVP